MNVKGAGDFDGPERLAALLLTHGIDANAWRQHPGAKSVDHLFTELELGESRLEFFSGGVGVRRLVEVVKVRVSRPSEPHLTLLEAEQRFSDGTSRSRRRSLSEKIFPHEYPLEAATRGVLEELGPGMAKACASSIELDAESLVSWVEFKASSKSFPMLPTRYQLFAVDGTVSGIPQNNFTTLEKVATPTYEYKIGRVWSGATLRRRRVKRLAVVPGESLNDAPDRAAAAVAVAGRPLELPEKLEHVWEWVDAREARRHEQERLQREAGQERRRMRAEAAEIAAARAASLRRSQEASGCVIVHDEVTGAYRVV